MPRKTTKVTTKGNAKVNEKSVRKSATDKVKTRTATARKTIRKNTTRPAGVNLIHTAAQSGFRREEVERLAYSLFENRGGLHGADLDDWLEAEKIVSRRL